MRHADWLEVTLLLLGLACVFCSALTRAAHKRRKARYRAIYRRYIQSAQWRARRERRKAVAGWRCEHRGLFGRCQERHRLHVHHLRYYDRHGLIFGRERDEDLKVLCPRHHGRRHAKRRRSAAGAVFERVGFVSPKGSGS